MKRYDENICLCTLNRIFGFSPKTGRALLEHFGSAGAVFSEGGKRIREALPYTEGIGRITDEEYAVSEKELAALSEEGCRFIGISDSGYPALLRECGDAPLGLYIRAETAPEDIFNRRKAVAVIGTRDLSAYGREWCGRTVAALAESPDAPVIVSGLAIGVDITAHRKALECGLPTIGVMATGIDDIYPFRHRADGMRICSSQGCALVTDYPPHTAPKPVNFLRRNRIIAGICSATILIESKAKGGGMMTARLAFGYDRDVFALPGRADDIRSLGCNILIREKVAEPIVGTDELLKSLGMKKGLPRTGNDMLSRYRTHIPEDRIDALSRILLFIKQNRDSDIEAIAEATGLEYSAVSGYIGLLEADGLIYVDLMRRCSIRI